FFRHARPPRTDSLLRHSRAARVCAAAAQPGQHRARGGGAVTNAVKLPPGPRLPVPIQGLAYMASRRRMMQVLGKRYGTAFTVRLPFFGPTVVISDPALVKQFFQTR